MLHMCSSLSARWSAFSDQFEYQKRRGSIQAINPVTGEFKEIFPVKATRIYAADIQGDYREEVIIVDEEGQLKVFCNGGARPDSEKPRYWAQQQYRRQKQNWNYYSP